MRHVINDTEQAIAGDYGHLRITYRRLTYTWTVTVYCGPTRVEELCGTWDEARPAYQEAQRIAKAAHGGVPTERIIAEKPSELVLQAVKNLLDTVPVGERRDVRPTLAGAHLTDLAPAQLRAMELAVNHARNTVYVDQAQRPTLRALARKGYGRLNYEPGQGRRKVIESFTLNTRGISEAARRQVGAA